MFRSFSNSVRTGFYFSVVALTGLALPYETASEEASKPPKRSGPNPYSRHTTAWQQVDFNQTRRIISAELVMGEFQSFGGKKKPDFQTAIDDAETLKLLEHGFQDAITFLPKKDWGYAGALPIGHLLLTATGGERIKLAIYSSYFEIPSKGWIPGGAAIIRSPSLAYTLDAILKSHGERGFSEETLAELSGESLLKSSIESAKQRLKDAKIGQADDS